MADNKNRLESILSRFDADWTASDEARREAKNDLFFSAYLSGMTGYHNTQPCSIAGSSMLYVQWCASSFLRCVRTLLMFCIVQRMEQVLTLLMC